MILVIGATGKVGTHLVTQLQAQQRAFRALAHSQASYDRLTTQGVDARLSDKTNIDAAFEGVNQVFLLTSNTPDQVAVERTFIDKAQAAGVQQIVKLSVFSADDPDVSLLRTHYEVEQHLQSAGIGYTILRPNLFMQNLVATDAATVNGQNAIYNSAGAGAMSFIDTQDIASVALAVLGNSRHVGKTYELTGPTALTYGDIAAKLSELLQRPISYVPLDDDSFQAALTSAGLPSWYATGLTELYRFYRNGKAKQVTTTVEQLTGQPARTIESYLAENTSAFVA